MKLYVINEETQVGHLMQLTKDVRDLPFGIDDSEIKEIEEAIEAGKIYNLRIQVYSTSPIMHYIITGD